VNIRKIYILVIITALSLFTIANANETDKNSKITTTAQETDKLNISTIKNESIQFIDSLIKNVQAAKIEYEKKIKLLEEQLSANADRIKQLTSVIETLKKENENLLTANKVIPELRLEIETLKKDREALQAEIYAVKGKGIEELKALTNSLNQALTAYSHSEIEIKNLKKTLTSQTAEITALTDRIKILQEKIELLEQEKLRKNDEITRLTAALDDLRAKNSELDSRAIAALAQRDKISTENAALKKENTFLNERINNLNKERENLLIENSKLTDNLKTNDIDKKKTNDLLAQRDSELDLYKNVSKQQSTKINSLTAELDKLKNEANAFIVEKQTLTSKIKEYERALADYDSTVITLKNKTQADKLEIERLNTYKDLYARVVKERDLQSAELENLKNEIVKLKIELTEASKQNQRKDLSLTEKDKIIESQKSELNKLYSKLKDLIK